MAEGKKKTDVDDAVEELAAKADNGKALREYNKGKKDALKLRKWDDFKATDEIYVPELLANQIIGQDDAVKIIRKAAAQRRNVLLIGEPGTGKSLLGQAMAELLPMKELQDVIVLPNGEDENNPRIKTVKAGQGINVVKKARMMGGGGGSKAFMSFFSFIVLLYPWILYWTTDIDAVIIAAQMIVSIVLVAIMALASRLVKTERRESPKLLINNAGVKKPPFIEATGAHAGALLGDVKHDPLQCILGDEIVHTPNGRPVAISELVDPLVGGGTGTFDLDKDQRFEVLGGLDQRFCYAPAKVNRVFKREYEGDMLEITTRRGYTIRVTPNHPLALLNESGDVEYVEAGKVTEGSPLVVPDRLPINAARKLSVDFMKLLAAILADGAVSDRFVTFKLKRKFKIDAITGLVRKNGFKPTIRQYRGATIININSADFVRKLEQMGVRVAGKKAMPQAIFDQSADVIGEFLSYYLSLDGYVNRQGQFELFSKEFVPQFLPLLMKVGLRPSVTTRSDPGFGKGRTQKIIYFSSYDFAKEYQKLTINPVHQTNLYVYFMNTSDTHVTFNDEIPVSFSTLEEIRSRTGLSKSRVHKSYYALRDGLRSSQSLTRGLLAEILNTMRLYTNCPALSNLDALVRGSYAYDRIVELKRVPYSGFVYNLTTDTGNYLVNNVLTHNSGGLGTPAHLRVLPGLIHKANKGVLFIDEIGTMDLKVQHDLLTAMQNRQMHITGRSEMSSGAMVVTEPVPCDFVLIAAGNVEVLSRLHPALRSRIQGYGYEVYMEDSAQDTDEERKKLVQFVAQEVYKDGKIPHFEIEAVKEILLESKKRAGRKGRLTLRLRELGGLVRAAGDLAIERKHHYVTKEDVKEAVKVSKTLEEQTADKYVERRREYEVIRNTGSEIGRVNGLAVIGNGGIVLPIVSEVTAAESKNGGKVIATGRLGDIAKEAVQNVSAIVKKYVGKNITDYDVHLQFLQTYEGVEGDSASVSVAVAALSALENVKVKQSVAMTGSIDVRGEVLPVGGITPKVEAAIEAGIKEVIIPKANKGDLILGPEKEKKIKVVYAESIRDVLENAIEGKSKGLLKKL